MAASTLRLIKPKAKNFSGDDPRAIQYLLEGRGWLERDQDRAKALRAFKKALKLGTTRAFKLMVLEIMSGCAQDLDDYEQSTDFMEQLCELNLTFENAMRLMTLYNETNNEQKRRAFGEKLKRIQSKNDEESRALVNLLFQCDDYDEVLERGKDWLEDHPEDLDISRTIINAYAKQHRYQEEYEFLQIMIRQGHEEALMYELFGFYKDIFDAETAHGYLLRHFEKNKEDKETYKVLLSVLMANASYSGLLSDAAYAAYTQELAALSAPKTENKQFTRNTDYFRKIRVGLLSYDFRGHSVGKFVLSLFAETPGNTGVELYCYYTYPDYEDEFTAVVRAGADVFKPVGKYSNSQLRKTLLEDHLDILIDLGGQTAGNKLPLMAERFAPVQMSWIGFPISTFTPNIDYQVGDPWLDPEEGPTENFLVEKVIRMKPCFLCFALNLDSSGVQAPEPPCVKNGYITFGNLSNPQKMSGATLRLWRGVLEQVPEAKLLIRFNAPQSDFFMDRFKARLRRHGLDLGRVVFGEKRELAGYFDTYNDIDIVLDTTPFCGWTTLAESFFMGVPTITYKGPQRQGRGWTLLAQVGLEDLGADTEAEYIQQAAALARDTARLRHIKQTLRQTMQASPLMDAKLYRVAFENMVRLAYLRRCFENKKPFRPDEGDTDSLFRDCMRAQEIVAYMVFENTPFKNIRLLAAEYLELAKALAQVLVEAYSKQPAALQIIQKIIDALPLVGLAQEGPSTAAVLKTINTLFARFA